MRNNISDVWNRTGRSSRTSGITGCPGKLWIVACFAVALLAVRADQACAQSAMASRSRPNILFLLADDWGWPVADVYGDSVVRVPTFDWVASHGMVFNNAFCAAPSCSPSRASILTGQYPHHLEEGSQLWGILTTKFPNYAVLLEKAGYRVGLHGKGYGPNGNEKLGGYAHNPAGRSYKDFGVFLDSLKTGQPFCFWFGSHKPHRPYPKGIGASLGIDPGTIQVPGFLPDVAEVQKDFIDYYYEVQEFDSACGEIIKLLREKGLLDNTLIVMSGDNGYPFPRAKANLYDGGTHIPLAIAWKGVVKPATTTDAFVRLSDLAPTFLESAGLPVPPEMTAKSLLPILKGTSGDAGRDRVYLEIERHAFARAGNVGYPMRAIRTKDYLYIRNFEPERWPAGDPTPLSRLGIFADCDGSPSKEFIIAHPELKPAYPGDKTYYELAFGKRPQEELYDLKKDPFEMNNLAGDAASKSVIAGFRNELARQMRASDDPRALDPHTDVFNHYPYYGGEFKGRASAKKKGAKPMQ